METVRGSSSLHRTEGRELSGARPLVCLMAWRLALRVRRRSRSTLTAAPRALRATRTRATIPLPAFLHDVSQLLALRRRKRIPHVQPVVDPGFLERHLRGADFLQLAVNRGAVRLVGGEKIVQIDPLHFEIGPVAYLRLAEIRLLLANFCDLFGRDANLFADIRVIQNAKEAEFSPSPARSACPFGRLDPSRRACRPPLLGAPLLPSIACGRVARTRPIACCSAGGPGGSPWAKSGSNSAREPGTAEPISSEYPL